MRIITLTIVVVTLLLGCSAPVKKVPVTPSTKVAVAAALPEKLVIQTIGTTMFNNKYMQVAIPEKPFPLRIRTDIERMIASSRKVRLIKSNGSLDIPRSHVSEDLLLGGVVIKNKELLIKKAKLLGADYILLVSGRTVSDTLHGTNAAITDLGVFQRSFLGKKESSSYAALIMVAIDTKTAKVTAERKVYSSTFREGKPWITSQKLPTGNQIEKILENLDIKSDLGMGLVAMGLK